MADIAIEPHPQPANPSPFFHTSSHAEDGSLAILHLKRDNLLPVTLSSRADDGYAEGAVTNTRFGSYPHSTLIGSAWGSQIRASNVDTGTRGRKGKTAPKNDQSKVADQSPVAATTISTSNKRELESEPQHSAKRQKKQAASDSSQATPFRAPVQAGSGFTHILPPTPEGWTSSLDHRTQVVYVPDYSLILSRLRVKPGDTLIEAGAGSGSFTHAAARAVFDGSPDDTSSPPSGRVFSYEYHEPRVETLREELHSHGLASMVHLTHRDVCTDGFATDPSPNAQAIFLDLPAPWLALRHLTRSGPESPLHPQHAVHICTFSPCIEQVSSTVSALRQFGWTNVEMVEVQNRRIDVRRERIGLAEEGLRGVNAVAASVDESLARLREVEGKLKEFHALRAKERDGDGDAGAERKAAPLSKSQRLLQIKRKAEGRKLFKEGNLVHRTEPEVKTHTSYLVFAVLPREWTDEDERRCSERWPLQHASKDKTDGKSTKTN